MTPFQRKIETNIYTLPCGKCPFCFKRRVSAWSFRLMEEEKISSSSYFVTLTYDTKYIHLTPKGFMNLNKRDIQLFMKRLRKDNKEKVKYYLCGEYGGKTNRPHYHLIIFNAKIETIQPNWNKGQIHYGQVSEASVGYTLKYMAKPSKIPLHQNDDRQKEFSLMSKGLGKNYINEKMSNWHKNDPINRVYCNLKDGKKIAMPRYYKDKIYNLDERGQIKAHFSEKARIELEELAYNPKVNEIMRSRNQSIKQEFINLKNKQNERKN